MLSGNPVMIIFKEILARVIESEHQICQGHSETVTNVSH